MISMRSVLKAADAAYTVTGAACAAAGIVALSSLAASGAAVCAVVGGFKSAAETMQKILADEPEKKCESEKSDGSAADEANVDPDADNSDVSAK